MPFPMRPARSFLSALLVSGALAAQTAPSGGDNAPSPAPAAQNPPEPAPPNPNQNLPFAVVNPYAAETPPPPGPRFSLDVTRQDVGAVLRTLARKSGKSISILEMPPQFVSIQFTDLPFDRALAQILAAGGLDFRKVDEGYVVGPFLDLRLKYPQPGEGELDATFRCARVSALTLVTALTAAFPAVRFAPGPLFLSPELKENAASGTETSVKAMNASDAAFRTRDILMSGPADLVRRALTLAQKLDYPRRQVRVNVKVVTLSDKASSSLGVKWMSALEISAAEQTVKDASGSSTSLVDGIRLGKFSHSPMLVSATLNALEQKGLAKTLSNPTLTILDGERSFILDGQKFVYPDFKGKDNNGQGLYGAADVKIGVYLQVAVKVASNDDMVLTIYPQVTALAGTSDINGVKVPNLFTSEEQTTVRATSGEVVVLGGMIKDSTSTSRDGMPFLSRIPLLGYLFGSTARDRNRFELMIVVTPELVEEKRPDQDVEMTVRQAG